MASASTRERIEIAPGAIWFPGYFDQAAQEKLRDAIRAVVKRAPLFTPRMPRTGKPFSVRMTNCGALGWVSDEKGYRYQPDHPDTGDPWPEMPSMIVDAWRELANYPHAPEACLVNFYDPKARMGLHQDRDENEFDAPVLSLSLGDSARFRVGGTERGATTKSIELKSGDAFVLGGASRLAFHGVDRIYANSSPLLKDGGRINLTMRRVNKPD
ncbi:alpha-ketoglutarate-dependent dioxygenase AlkB [Terrarubrum flagellatum]|uniref:alpha-ketoglutarate-dependent dioxygenase AlkB n=1 Tax=Terrirubrum flagellatum TaxID=2895980 RepID=UPI0031456D57